MFLFPTIGNMIAFPTIDVVQKHKEMIEEGRDKGIEKVKGYLRDFCAFLATGPSGEAQLVGLCLGTHVAIVFFSDFLIYCLSYCSLFLFNALPILDMT